MTQNKLKSKEKEYEDNNDIKNSNDYNNYIYNNYHNSNNKR